MPYLHSDRRKILLVDQNSRIQNLRANILRNYDVEVHTAESLIEAAPLWRNNSYDLILLDGRSPEAADTLSAEIRESKPRQRIGVLIGPPTFIKELGRAREKKSAGIKSMSAPAQAASTVVVAEPQWQLTVQKIVADWYLQHSLS